MTTDLEIAAEARQIAEHKLAEVRATVEAKALEATRMMIESPQPVVVPWQEYPGYDDFSHWPSGLRRAYLWSDLSDRTEGRYRPLYETEQELRRMRATGRRLKEFFPVAEGALRAIGNYVIGPGFEFTAQPKDETGKVLASMVQKVLDGFLEVNNFSGVMDREIHDQSRIEGEAFPTLYEEDGGVRLELTDPDAILEPLDKRPLEQMCRTGHKLNYWWHGVHTLYNKSMRRDDIARPLGYHAVYDRVGDQWDYLPAARVEHIKRNVGRMSRRGWSDFDIICGDLEAEGKLRRNTAEGAAILAAIVMIRQHAEGVQRSSVEAMIANSRTGKYDKPIQDGTRSTNYEQVRPGTVKDIPFGMTATVGPLGELRSPVYIEVGGYVLRIIGLRWNSPEYMISGDASNANYSSTLVAESPFVKARECDQLFYAHHFVRLIWKALRMYHAMGALGPYRWQQIRAAVKLKADYPAVASRDELQRAQRNQILSDMGVMSKRSIAADSGLDYDEEQKDIKAEPKTPKPQPFGVPGADPFGRTVSLATRAMESLLDAKP